MKKSMDGVWVQQFDLVRLTGCWDPRLEIRMWSNVACVLREELEISMMFFKASRWLEVYG